jgi:DNA-binding MarR family transcriptional regulator
MISGNATDLLSKDVIADIGSSCLLLRTRLVSRVIASIYDKELHFFGLGSAQFTLLVAIHQMQPATRADIGRFLHQDRSTLTRNMRAILSEGWAEEIHEGADGRSRPVALSSSGMILLRKAVPAWQAAQAQASTLLGSDSVVDIANRVIDAHSRSPRILGKTIRLPKW